MPAPATLYCAHQTITESVRSSAASLDRTAAGAARDHPSSRTMSPTVRETSTATSSVPSPAAVSFQNNEAHSGAPESSASPELVLGDTAGPSFSLRIAFHRSPTSLESRCSRYWLQLIQVLLHGRLLHLSVVPLKEAQRLVHTRTKTHQIPLQRITQFKQTPQLSRIVYHRYCH